MAFEFRQDPMGEAIAESVQLMTTWINEQIEAGATDALVETLRKKGWTVTPPEPFDAEPRALPS